MWDYAHAPITNTPGNDEIQPENYRYEYIRFSSVIPSAGNGDCGPGGAERTIYTAAAAPASDLEAVISEGDQAYADVQQVATLLAP